ncbi:MAG: cyclic nucleotide-binding domain-containing protein [Pseudomonadota bacterium]
MRETQYLISEDISSYRLEDMPLFSSLKAKYLDQLLSVCKIRSFDEGEVIIKEGARDCWVYVLISGKVAVSIQTVEITVLFQRGDVFGESAFISQLPRSGTITAQEPTECLAIDAVLLSEVHSSGNELFFAQFYHFLVRLLLQRLGLVNEELVLVKRAFKMAVDRKK